ncbi:anaphase-promoting complex subunit 1 [Eutrema salsugineum]|nr:anaphase-promoting complex subunit 1 [Eutrema salsugineum]
MAELLVKSDSNVCDSLSISSLKVALAYNEEVSSGRLASSGGFVQSIFLASIGKRCEEILNSSRELKMNLRNYLTSEAWPDDYNSKLQKDTNLLMVCKMVQCTVTIDHQSSSGKDQVQAQDVNLGNTSVTIVVTKYAYLCDK